MFKQKKAEAVPYEAVEGMIFVIRGKKVMLDRDLARLYGVTTKRLNEQVKRNRTRFPQDFIFQFHAAAHKYMELIFAQG